MSRNPLLDHPQALTNMIRRVALEAGAATLEYFDESGFMGSAEDKSDGSPVTIADREAEVIIEKALADILPDVPMIGEEAVSEGRIPDISKSEYFWLVDPLDGTKEFISGSGDYTVNIALIKNDSPVLGVVYAPAKGELYAGCGVGTAIRWMEDTDTEKSIRVRKPPMEGLTVVSSKSHGDPLKLDAFLSGFKVAKTLKRGSSLKICAIAAGKADLYPRFGATCEWDTAAAHAVLQAAGGEIVAVDDNKPLRYGKADRKFLNPEFICCKSSSSLLV